MRRAAAVLVAVLLWSAALALTVQHGFWRAPLTRDTGATEFAKAVRARIPAGFGGALVAVVLREGEPAATFATGPMGAVPDGAMVFQLASLSKWLTAAAVLTLVDAGRIGLDDPVEDHLTRWRFADGPFDSRAVTVRRLLSHTAGLTDGLGYNGFADPGAMQSLEESLAGAADAMPGASGRVEIGAPPGGRFAYSGGSYAVLQLMIEEVTGQDFGTAMRELVFAPLDMRGAAASIGDIEGRLAPNLDLAGKRMPLRQYSAPAAASLFAGAEDLALFLRGLHLPKARGGLLSDAALAAMAQPEARVFGLPVWGLGATLYVRGRPGELVIGHDGRNMPAINTAARLHRPSGDGIVVLATGTQGLATDLANDWVFWRTGRVPVTALPAILPVAGLLWAAGLAAIALVVVRAGRRRR
ncbi:serine hydrolase domain-containing protein [Thetidibacter halocola]|uniref:Beta-lactamase family protein n=1 Tax=Thetidibacter halocola TaxID=2827239 RepID=A0A8J7WG69_9RHOB|nr:serine hydrolase domain-containing protein [Thetidibacter halocola]MBS0124483.1 beta-lactamase family protein [Thetidibacter halocola]